MVEQYLISAPGLGLPRGREFWTDPDYTTPRYSPGQIATQFFGRSGRWLSMARRDHGITDDQLGPGVIPRENATSTGRRYSLHHVERLIHRLLMVQAIDGNTVVAGVTVVKATAVLHGYGGRIRRIEEDYVREQARDAR